MNGSQRDEEPEQPGVALGVAPGGRGQLCIPGVIDRRSRHGLDTVTHRVNQRNTTGMNV